MSKENDHPLTPLSRNQYAAVYKEKTFPKKILFAFNGFLAQNSSSFRNNCLSGGVLLDPHFANLGRRDPVRN